MSTKQDFITYIKKLQSEICESLEAVDGKESFITDKWKRPGGGGGTTRVISGGNVFEKGGVNISEVHGELSEGMKKQLNVKGTSFFACGLSLVIHPLSPMVPTVHANFRYFELYDENGTKIDNWFGGGTDLTPYYLFKEDVIHFHQTLKAACDKFDKSHYGKFKKACDHYFYNSHRNEARGIGGLFYDYLRPNEFYSEEHWKNFVMHNGKTFLEAYVPIVLKRKKESYGEDEKKWQEIRRGRYVEFNLIHDKGTLFGLRTNGRIESILMSLPATVRWEYDHHPEENSREEEMLKALEPRDWASINHLNVT